MSAILSVVSAGLNLKIPAISLSSARGRKFIVLISDLFRIVFSRGYV